VYIEGIPSSEGYESKDGKIKSSLTVNVKEIELLGAKAEKVRFLFKTFKVFETLKV